MRDMLEQTFFAISHDESRYALNGVALRRAGPGDQIVATDGHRLALGDPAAGERGTSASGSCPPRPCRRSRGIVGSGEDVQVAISETSSSYRCPTSSDGAAHRGHVSQYEQVVPKAHPHRIAISREPDGGATAGLCALGGNGPSP